jgi:SAM-dependent methyltransferase
MYADVRGERGMCEVRLRRPVAGISFDRAAQTYDDTRGLPLALMDAAVAALARALVGGRVLEVGVGTGRFALPLGERGLRVVGLDISEKMITRAQAKGAHDLVLGSATRIPFGDRAFPSTIAIHLLHLIRDWPVALREIGRVTSVRFVTLLETITTCPVGGEAPPPGHGPGDAYHPIRRYEEIAARWGYTYEHPGVRPPQMIESAAPSLRLRVGRHAEVVSGDALLAPAAVRSYSSQWAVSDEIHGRVMEVLTAEMSGRDFERTWEIEVVGWTPDALLRM